MRIILLITIGANLLWASDVLIDSKTSLMWQDNSQAKSIKRNWQGAQEYCNALVLEGHDDWRLPHIKELQSIVDIKRYKPTINKEFHYIALDYYWSSSSYVSDEKYAWYVCFINGDTYYSTKTTESNVRCVRGDNKEKAGGT